MAIWRVGAQGQFTDPPTREDKLLTTVVIVGMIFAYGAVLGGVVFQPTTTPFSQATSLVGLLAGGYAAAYLVHADHRWYVLGVYTALNIVTAMWVSSTYTKDTGQLANTYSSVY